MPISRMQDPRQLYGLGSIVKSIGKGVKSFVGSPIGKAAILGFGANALMGGNGFGSLFSGSGGSGIASMFNKAKGFVGNNKMLSAGIGLGLGGEIFSLRFD